MPPRPGAPAQRATGDRPRPTPCTSTTWTASSRSAAAATASPSTSTSTSSTAPAVPTSPSAASPASRRRPATHLFLLHSLFRSGAWASARSTPRRSSSRSRARTCCSSTTPTSSSTTTCAPSTPSSACPPSRSSPSRSSARRCPDDTTGRPQISGRTTGVHAFWWTLHEFCTRTACCPTSSPTPRTNASSTRWSSTRSPTGCASTPSPAGTDGAVKIDGVTCRSYADLLDVIEANLSDEETRATGPGRSPASAPSTPSCAGFAARSRRCPR